MIDNRAIQEAEVRATRERFHLDEPEGWDERVVQRITDIALEKKGQTSKAEQDRNYRRRKKIA